MMAYRKSALHAIRTFFMMALALAAPLWSGTTGKISGTVTDKTSREPLPGVNVVVAGTMLGGVTDLNGNYTILYVPPGHYSVTVSLIGYQKVTVTDIRVLIDETAPVDVNLDVASLEGETVTIVADRNVLKKDVATSGVSIGAKEVNELPVSNIQDVVAMQAGIQGQLNIRGGRAEDALFQMDGVTLRDPRNNQPISSIALSAVKEISVERGGFNAEYGQVRSGIVKVVTQEGSSDNYYGTVTFRASPPAPKYFGISPFDQNSMWMKPYVDDAVCWDGTAAGWDEYTQRQYPAFEGWNEISRIKMTDNNPSNDLSPLGCQKLFLWETRKKEVTNQPDYNVDAGLGGPIPWVGKSLGNLRFFTSYRRERNMLLIPLSRDDYQDYDWTLQVNSDISPSQKLQISGLYGKQFTMAQNWPSEGQFSLYLRTPYDIAANIGKEGSRPAPVWGTGVFSLADIRRQAYSAKYTNLLSTKTFYEVQMEFVNSQYFSRPSQARDLTLSHEIVPGYRVDEAPFGYSSRPVAGITGIEFGGHTCKWRDHSNVSSATVRADLTSQANFNNLIKTGAEFVYNDLSLDFGQIESLTGGNTYTNRIQMQVRPVRAALYFQDKLETKGFIANLGLRLDYSNSNADWVDVDPYNKSFYSSKYKSDTQFPQKKTKSQFQLSPRLSISHPVTENSKLFFNYGHFKQMPSYEDLFRLGRASDRSMVQMGDPNLILAKTVSYELGYDHLLLQDYLIQMSAFYHDITDQDTTTQYIGVTGPTYIKTTSNNYEDIRGFEVTVSKNRGRWWTGFGNYTYQVSSTGNFGRGILYQDPSRQKEYDEETTNIYQKRPIPRPYARASATLYAPEGFGPRVLGIHPLSAMFFNVLVDWQSGNWRTWNSNNISGIVNNVQQKDWFNTVFRLAKSFKSKWVEVQLFVDMENALNTRSMSLVNWGKADDYENYMRSLHLPKSNAYDNIVGKDRVGEYRKPGADFQPIETYALIDPAQHDGKPGVIYYEMATGRYMEDVNQEAWTPVAKARINRILKDKAYIDMPNMTSFTFLNPRQIFFGIRLNIHSK